ncbi:MAG: hypothetical protein A3F12_02260 [Gammaproteobacteria bacterium RIFCSPHIGHO2_12_FULL_38_14]|nr:MAG: hypothetical protein A3F12_02260 [Gammaproteobacteria bacterium RIFCSPHIGHO2_12_FULL_38_14]
MKQLIHEWKQLFSPQWFKEDLFAGAIVACVAIPLSLAIALASGVPPETGLITAIIAGIVCALFAGSPLTVSGPAAAMAVLVATIVKQYGLSGILMVGLGCGLLQILTGVFRLGFLIRFVPLPVVAGFTAGIGAIILVGQFPRALGLPPITDPHLAEILLYVSQSTQQIQWQAAGLALLTLFITFSLPRFLPRYPAPLIAVIIATLIAVYFKMSVEAIGVLPQTFSLPSWPTFPNSNYMALFTATLLTYALASLETLLSSSAVDKITRQKPHQPDQELISQGLGNMFSAFFGGIPVTGVIARSALNIQAGAKTRRASIFHSIFLLFAVYFFSSWIGQIPIAVLAGVLISVALRMCHPREFIEFLHASRSEALIYLITFFVIIATDLIVGVQAGIAAALIVALFRLAYIKTHVYEYSGHATQVHLDGPLTFLSFSQLDKMINKLSALDLQQGLIIDLSKTPLMDLSAASQLVKLIEDLKKKNVSVVLQGINPSCYDILLSVDASVDIASLIAYDKAEILHILHRGKTDTTLDRLAYGVEVFKQNKKPRYQSLFRKLAYEQKPHTLFITCSDSRINPNLITSTDPGELFLIRNVGNIIPVFHLTDTYSEGAAIEYAVGILKVKDIVICAHSGCGAMQALIAGDIFNEKEQVAFPHIARWLENIRKIRDQFSADMSPVHAAKLNALLQYENIKTYPIVQQKMQSNELKVRVWYYDIGKSELEQWDDQENMFIVIGSKQYRALQRRVQSGSQFQAPIILDDEV